jgi:hypothetical protein
VKRPHTTNFKKALFSETHLANLHPPGFPQSAGQNEVLSSFINSCIKAFDLSLIFHKRYPFSSGYYWICKELLAKIKSQIGNANYFSTIFAKYFNYFSVVTEKHSLKKFSFKKS